MCDVYREVYSSQKMFTNQPDIGLSLWASYEKTIDGVEIHWFTRKEKFTGPYVSKESNADCLLRHEEAHHYWFPAQNSAF